MSREWDPQNSNSHTALSKPHSSPSSGDSRKEPMRDVWADPKPGFKWPVAVAREIPAPAEIVWDAISMPGNLEQCHPFCARNVVKVWPGEDSIDEIHYLSGWMFERRFQRWIDGIGYDIEIGRPGGRMSFVSWRIRSVDDQICKFRIAIYPSTLLHLPAVVRWAPHFTYLAPRLKSYLSSVIQGFEWYVTRREPVPRNQFGSHPWFSASGGMPDTA